MRNGLRVLFAVAFAAGVAACDGGNDDMELYEAEEAATPSLETSPGPDAALMTAQFQPGEGATEAARISGTVHVFAAGGRDAATTPAADGRAAAPTGESGTTGQGFRVEVSVNGLSQGEHAWHIHSGPCGEEAPVVVAFSPTEDSEGLTNPLNADESGHAEAEATVPADELTIEGLRAAQHSLHVHAQGGVDHGPTVACADLRDQGSTTM
ncbi:MAG TPA: CHRD domain-containing protein [Longimicrobiales bacterium]|nr:CHRD domain-containing protein [Longimicrobiales bacterium]